MITEEMKDKYFDSQGYECPFCGTRGLISHGDSHNGINLKRRIGCTNCHKRWNDVYIMVNIEEVEDE